MTLQVSERLLAETFAHFQACGNGERECVCYWVASLATPTVVERVVHPKHEASGSLYVIDDAWLTRFFISLADEGCSISAQTHTHGTIAFHSTLDDEFAAVATPGFVSVVFPDFATHTPSLADIFVAVFTDEGRWEQAPSGFLRLA